MTPCAGGRPASFSSISWVTISSETSSPASITALIRSPSGVPAFFSWRSMSPVDSWTMPRRSTRRLAWVPLPAPGGPSRIMFIAPPLAPAEAALQLRFLDEVAILVGDQMALDLGHRIHRHVDDDEQRGAAEIEGDAHLRDQEFGHEADQGEIGG